MPFATPRNFSPNAAKLSVILSRALLESSQLSLSLILGNEERKQEVDADRKTAKAAAKQDEKARKRWSKDVGAWNCIGDRELRARHEKEHSKND